MQKFISIWRGDESLAIVFWVYFVFINLAFQIFGLPLFLKFGWFGVAVLTIFEIVWLVWIVVSVWRSANNCKKIAFGYAAKLAVVIFVLVGVYESIIMFS